MVTHAALLLVVHGQPAATVTATVPVPAAPPSKVPVGAIDEAHGSVNANGFDTVLRPVPVGPTAAIRAS
jgi:hypothetical protein